MDFARERMLDEEAVNVLRGKMLNPVYKLRNRPVHEVIRSKPPLISDVMMKGAVGRLMKLASDKLLWEPRSC